jgi:hypothetical protein
MKEASRKLERDAEPAWRKALAKYEREAEAAAAVDKAWRELVRAAVDDGTAQRDRPAEAEAPTKPPRPRIVTMDTSTEELQRLLADNPRGLLQMRDELAGWLGSFDRYGGNGADREFYLECWNGDAYVSDRVKFDGVPLRIEYASLANIGGIVPNRLREALADADDGLPARFIFIWPEAAPIGPLCDRGNVDASQRRIALETAARRLHALAMGIDDHGLPAPRVLKLDSDARRLFDQQRQEAMWQARTTTGLAAGWHGKNPGRLLRLALVFEHLAWAAYDDSASEPASASADAIARAGGFIDYIVAMFEHVIAGIAVTRAQADAAQVARHILSTARRAQPHVRLNERSLYQQRGFAWAREAQRRADAFSILRDAGWVRLSETDGHGRPRGDWEVHF